MILLTGTTAAEQKLVQECANYLLSDTCQMKLLVALTNRFEKQQNKTRYDLQNKRFEKIKQKLEELYALITLINKEEEP